MTEKEDSKFVVHCFLALVLFIALAMTGVIGCGTKVKIVRDGNTTTIITNYRGEFSVKQDKDGNIEVKGESNPLKIPKIPSLINFGTGKKEEE